MDKIVRIETPDQSREPWNKGKVIGARPPLRPKHVWAVRTRLQLSHRLRLRVPEVDSKYLSSDHSDEHHHQVLYACTASVWWSYLCSLVICHCRGWSTNLLVIGGFIVLLAISPCPRWGEGERLHLPRA